MKKIEFQCCLCGEGISETAVDPCAVVLVANWRAPVPEQAEQQFFCHLACFKSTVWSNVPVAVEDLLEDR